MIGATIGTPQLREDERPLAIFPAPNYFTANRFVRQQGEKINGK